MARSYLQMVLEDTAMFAVLELWDYAIIALIVLLLTGGIRIGSLATRPRSRLEKKIDLILRHLGIVYADPQRRQRCLRTCEDWLVSPQLKSKPIVLHREQTATGLMEASTMTCPDVLVHTPNE